MILLEPNFGFWGNEKPPEIHTSYLYSSVVLNVIRAEIGPGDRFWNWRPFNDWLFPTFAWVANLKCKWAAVGRGGRVLQGCLSHWLEPPEQLPDTAASSDFSLSPPYYCPHLSGSWKEGQVGIVEAHGGTVTKKRVVGKILWRIKQKRQRLVSTQSWRTLVLTSFKSFHYICSYVLAGFVVSSRKLLRN